MNLPREALRDAGQFEEVYARVMQAAGAETQMDLARRLGIRQSSVSDAKKKRRVPSSWVLSLCIESGWNPRWLLTGEPPRRLVAGGKVSREKIAEESGELMIVAVHSPEICRIGQEWVSPEISRICIPVGYDCPGLLVLPAGEGGFEPHIRRGAYVGIETARASVADGDIYAVLLPEAGLVFRRVFLDIGREALQLRGEDKDAPLLTIPLGQKDARLVGRVAWTLQRL
ncbi:CI repressor [Desulfovibrio sp. X2]|uniref:helix-turn-helix domain-containing protein n=1 Tax=Desulfovibrio sp. X2 TaxID=941449 RepID=UPI0003587D92|nr:helix-turn-helix domain-containing protein [Desulfovibrio sp. X2]EPR43676.1 CI repressor [Desulfovibrio sp. X2]